MSIRKKKTDASVEDILGTHNLVVRGLVERLRSIILETVPAATESAHASWHSLNYRHPESGHFCAIFPQNDRVSLAFEFGVLLPDRDGLLEGDGKQVRYVRIQRESDIRANALKELLLAAIDLPAGREVRLGLIRSKARPVQDKS